MKARSHAKKGEFAEAQKLYQAVSQTFPKNIRAQQGLAALNKPKQNNIIKIAPHETVNQLINLYNQGQHSAVVEQAQGLTAQYPETFLVWNILGASAFQIGMLDKAIEAYNKALSIKPDYAEAYNNIGVALKSQGMLDKAIEAYNEALLIIPDYAEAYNNMGIALKSQGMLDKAIEAYNKALLIIPDYAEAYNNMGNALKSQGKLDKAIEAYNKALSIKPNFAEACINMGIAIEGLIFKKPNSSLQSTIISLLDQKSYVRPRNIAKTAVSLLKLEPTLNKHLRRNSVDQLKPPVQKVIANLSELTLLLKLMSVCPIEDIELEYLLKELRARLLLSNSSLISKTEVLRFQSALALQCFSNEYIYSQSEDEDKALEDLDGIVKLALSNDKQQNPQSILCLASYKPLNHYEWCDKLLITTEIQDVFTRQVLEPKQETNFKSELPLLKEINNEISSKVRDQYESNPYPRWVKLGLPLRPVKISKVVDKINLKLFEDRIKEVEVPSILIAGCGTGQESIETAARFKGSKVIAIDLSLSSLAYAKRKTEELGIQNIEYMQADILDLDKFDKHFDILASTGVLHHMDDPIAGWQVLTDCLKPGGLMRIGLYSELARQNIVKIREEILEAGIGSNDADMKLFRLKVMNSEKKHHKQILNSSDFYSLSELRDLLFHVQEHRFTIPQIQECLLDLGLKFCGFEAEKIVSQFKLTNTNTDDCYKLDKWQAYEEANPRVFSGMYQFWCQKIS